ncbi:Cytochrome b5 domain-containing protein 1 [Allomyces javanicus]|nr:Cytochrome b5 domain-containing protein 1 [Allomyces javanicus]
MPEPVAPSGGSVEALIDAPKAAYFTPAEVARHNTVDDLWVSWLGTVYNLTPLAKQFQDDARLLPLRRNAGRDISHWFDASTGDLRQRIDPATGLRVPVCPDGVPPHVPDVTRPATDWTWDVVVPWWRDVSAAVGKLSRRTRHVRIVNTLTQDVTVLEVCAEEPVTAIVGRYLQYNKHAKGYVWKYLGRVLDMAGTLEQNGIPDEADEMDKVGMNEHEWMVSLFLYFSDDLTVA